MLFANFKLKLICDFLLNTRMNIKNSFLTCQTNNAKTYYISEPTNKDDLKKRIFLK